MHSWRAVTVLTLRPRMTAKQYRDAIQALGLSQAGAAQFFKVDDQTSRRWWAPSPVSIETMFLIEFKPFLGV